MAYEQLAFNLDLAIEHTTKHHMSSDGWITVAKKEGKGFKQYHFRVEELRTELSNWLGEDVYFSQNTFYKPSRKIENIRQLRALYVDVDSHNLGYDPDWVLRKLELEIFGQSLPEPNIIIFSGRGLACIWRIKPTPSTALPLWQVIQNHFCKQLEYVGSDYTALDAARVFRIAGSVNSKSGLVVRAQYRHNYLPELRDIQREYLPEFDKKPKKGKKSKKGIHHLHNQFKLHYTRLMDLVKLCELRKYKMNGYREIVLFLYRYWSCCYLKDPEKAVQDTLELNDMFTSPLIEKTVRTATRSAEKAYEARYNEEENRKAREKGYKYAGYNYTNEKLIELLKITPEEQQQLQTIIGNEEYRRRDREYQRKKRRENGAISREKYLEQEKNKTQDKIQLLKHALEEYPNVTQKELAKILGWNQSTISRHLKKLNNMQGSSAYIMGL